MTTAKKPIRWKRDYAGSYTSACGNYFVWLGGDECWYASAIGSKFDSLPRRIYSEPMGYKRSAQQWCELHAARRYV